MTKPKTSKLFIAILFASVLAACGGEPTEGSIEREFPHDKGRRYLLMIETGRLLVRKAEGDKIRIKATFVANSLGRFEEMDIVASEEDGVVVLRPKWPGGEPVGAETCAIEAWVPVCKELVLMNRSGSVQTQALEADCLVSLNLGRLDVYGHKGLMKVTGDTAHAVVRGLVGPFEADCRQTRIEVDRAEGPVRVDTTNGSIKVLLSRDNPGPVRLKTTKGRIQARFGTGFRGKLEACTVMGGIKIEESNRIQIIESEQRFAVLAFDQLEQVSKLENTKGKIEIRLP